MLRTGNLLRNLSKLHGIRSYSTEYVLQQKLTQAFATLNLEETDDFNEVREKYLVLVKRYHPDTGGEEVCLSLYCLF